MLDMCQHGVMTFDVMWTKQTSKSVKYVDS
jgi:hypothetical protein